MTVLFVYGTLRDAEYQRALFGHALPARPATLPDWMPAFTSSGYLTIVPAPGDAVTGDLITLGDAELALADGWEDVPLYVRTPIEVMTAGGVREPAWAYVRASESRDRAPDGVLSRNGRDRVLAEIRAFRATRG